jgi:predicted MFS family arabinose efflux permease
LSFELAVLEALRLDQSNTAGLASLTEKQWGRMLDWCDRSQLTIPLARTCLDAFPKDARLRAIRSMEKNRERTRRVRAAFDEIETALRERSLDFTVLKGFTQAPDFGPDVEWRVQYDLDLFLPAPSVYAARDVLLGLRYEVARGYDGFPTDHLPVMVRKTGWEWRGDFFDPEIPPSVDLHYRFWDAETEGFEAPGTDEFWERRRMRQGFPALHLPDALGYSTLHLLRHLLRGSVRPFHVYELAWFLHHRTTDEQFWVEWQSLHPPSLRRLEAIMFHLAQRWFRCSIAEIPAAEPLAAPVTDWLDRYALSPLHGQFEPNKDELLLHLCLIDSARGKWKVIRRRVLPLKPPAPVDATHLPKEKLTAGVRVRSGWRYAQHVVKRFTHHAMVLPPLALHGVQWKLRGSGLSAPFVRLLAATTLFNLGNFVFFVLYNLHLLRLGFREDFLGAISTAMTVGSIAGTLPGGWLAQRLEVRRALPMCAALLAILFVLRSWATSKALLLAAASMHGFVFSCWAVMIIPSVARLTEERSRATAYSFFMASGIAMGIFGGFLAGGLPGWLGSTTVLYLSSLVVALSIPALLRLPRLGPGVAETRVYPKGRFLIRFLTASAVWNLGTGAFNPFFNAFFQKQMAASTSQIGTIFSAGQMSQIAALMIMPLLLRNMRLLSAVCLAQVVAAVTLMALSVTSSMQTAALVYVTYMSAQYVSEPRLFALLMGRLRPEQQGGASALNFLTSFSSEALAAAISGIALARFGYPPVLVSAGAVTLLAAFLFLGLRDGVRDDAKDLGTVPR